MIDIHSHLLPGLDDGAATLEDALALARALVEDGVTHVVATPHWTPELYVNRRAAIDIEARRFAQALRTYKIPLALSSASEVRVSPELPDWIAAGDVAFLGCHEGFDLVLLEMPDAQVPPGIERLVRVLLDRAVRPVLAHPERNRAVMERPERLRPLIEMGCLTQLTAGSVLGEFGARALRTAHVLLDNDWVHAVANDAHNLRARRPRMHPAREALAQRIGVERASWLTQAGPGLLVSGNEIH